MAVEAALGVSVVRVVAGEVPDDERLVAAAGEEHVRVLEAGGERGHPAAVAFERPTHDQLLTHAGRWSRTVDVRMELGGIGLTLFGSEWGWCRAESSLGN